MPDTRRRIQLRRAKGWRLPENTVVVARPTKWGNPYRPGPAFESETMRISEMTPLDCVEAFRANWQLRLASVHGSSARALLSTLRGKNLACWCAMDQPCHADVLLEIANG